MSDTRPMLRARFVRAHERHDRVFVRRSDGSDAAWTFPTYGDGLPHDLVHLVVESAFGLRDGFWGRVDGGVDVARVNAEANRAGGKDKYADFGADRRGALLAEALAGARWLAEDQSPDELRDGLAATCARLGVAPVPVSDERIAAVREVLLGLRRRWRALAPREALDLEFDPRAPEESFARMRAT